MRTTACLMLAQGVHDDYPQSGMPSLVRRLMQRHDEARRDITTPRHDPLTPVVRPRPDGVVGMPLGLPPMDGGDIRIIATWIAQGAN